MHKQHIYTNLYQKLPSISFKCLGVKLGASYTIIEPETTFCQNNVKEAMRALGSSLVKTICLFIHSTLCECFPMKFTNHLEQDCC